MSLPCNEKKDKNGGTAKNINLLVISIGLILLPEAERRRKRTRVTSCFLQQN